MAVEGDNRGEQQTPVAPRPDGTWLLDDARKHREQRTAAQDTDAYKYALSLADNLLTSDEQPCSDENLEQAEQAASSAPAIPPASDPERPQPIADDILLALQHDQRPERDTNLAAPQRPRSSSQARPPRWPRPRRRLLVACAAAAILAAALEAPILTHPARKNVQSTHASIPADTSGPLGALKSAPLAAAAGPFTAPHSAHRNPSNQARPAHAYRTNNKRRATQPKAITRAPASSTETVIVRYTPPPATSTSASASTGTPISTPAAAPAAAAHASSAPSTPVQAFGSSGALGPGSSPDG